MLSQRDPGPEKRPPGHRKITLLRICLLYIYIYKTIYYKLVYGLLPPSHAYIRRFPSFDSPLPSSSPSAITVLSRPNRFVVAETRFRPPYPGGG